jgi:hypothetical protein
MELPSTWPDMSLFQDLPTFDISNYGLSGFNAYNTSSAIDAPSGHASTSNATFDLTPLPNYSFL